MSRNYHELLTRFDSTGIDRYGITAEDLAVVEKYVRILQAPIFPITVWGDALRTGGEYGTSIIIHEVVQIRGLGRLGIEPLAMERHALQQALAEHIDVHVVAIYEEHLYLQEILTRKYHRRFEVATLVKANRRDDRDLNYLRDSDVGVFLLEEDRVEEARKWLDRLKEGERAP